MYGVSQTPVLTDISQSGWTRTRYGSASVQAPVETISLAGIGHSLPPSGMARMVITFFGLDGTTPPTTPPTTAPAGGRRVTAPVTSWNTGLTTPLTIANTGSTTVNAWSLAFTPAGGRSITSGGHATHTPTPGQVTARNAGYNGTIAPGSSVSIAFQATHSGNTATPAGYTLNGAACSTA